MKLPDIHWQEGQKAGAAQDGGRAFEAYLAWLRDEKRAEAKGLPRKQLEAAYVDLCCAWAKLLQLLEMTERGGDQAIKNTERSFDEVVEYARTAFKGHSKGGKIKNAEPRRLRQLARDEWPTWQPKAGRRSKSAYHAYFFAEHEMPAELTRMYKWLKGL